MLLPKWIDCFLVSTLGIFCSSLHIPDLPNEAYCQMGDINLALLTTINNARNGTLCAQDFSEAPRIDGSEAFRYAIDHVNSMTTLLPNVTLGFVILDTCGRDIVAFGRSLYLIQNDEENSCSPTDFGGASRNGSRHWCQYTPECLDVSGVVGPSTSREAIHVATAMGLMNVPVMGTLSSSDELSDTSRFGFFLRLVPSDKFRVDAIVDLLTFFNSTYASMLYSEGSYGENIMKALWAKSATKELCVGVTAMIPSVVTEHEVLQRLMKVRDERGATTILLFLEEAHKNMVFKAIAQTSDLWVQHLWIFDGSGYARFEETPPNGTISVSYARGQVPEFQAYYEALNITSSKNPWVVSYLAERTNDSSCPSHNLSKCFTSNEAVALYMDAVLAYAFALDSLINDHCPEFRDFIDLRKCIQGKLLMKYLSNVSFEGYGDNISFTSTGDIKPHYVIKQHITSTLCFSRAEIIGSWDLESHPRLALRLDDIDSTVYWNMSTVGSYLPRSVCGHPCGPREYRIQSELWCCWECHKCRANQYSNVNQTKCMDCAPLTWPDDVTGLTCVPITPSSTQLDEPTGLVIVLLASLGIVVSIGVTFAYVRWSDTRLIKASSRELSALTMVGIVLAYCTVYPILAEPTDTLCRLAFAGFGISISFIYIPILVKTNRVDRIFRAGKKGIANPKFIGTKAQLVICIALLAFQVRLHSPYPNNLYQQSGWLSQRSA